MTSPKLFIRQFTVSFLQKMYGAIDCFNIDPIIQEATPHIQKRMNVLRAYLDDSALVDYVFQHGMTQTCTFEDEVNEDAWFDMT